MQIHAIDYLFTTTYETRLDLAVEEISVHRVNYTKLLSQLLANKRGSEKTLGVKKAGNDGERRKNEKNGDISTRANFLARLPADNNSSSSGAAAWGRNFISIPLAHPCSGVGTRFRVLVFLGL